MWWWPTVRSLTTLMYQHILLLMSNLLQLPDFGSLWSRVFLFREKVAKTFLLSPITELSRNNITSPTLIDRRRCLVQQQFMRSRKTALRSTFLWNLSIVQLPTTVIPSIDKVMGSPLALLIHPRFAWRSSQPQTLAQCTCSLIRLWSWDLPAPFSSSKLIRRLVSGSSITDSRRWEDKFTSLEAMWESRWLLMKEFTSTWSTRRPLFQLSRIAWTTLCLALKWCSVQECFTELLLKQTNLASRFIPESISTTSKLLSPPKIMRDL